MQEQIQNFFTELRRGSLTLAGFGCLRQRRYGYALLQTLQQQGVDVEANTRYPLLRRLEGQGLLDSDWDTGESRPRKYYSINEQEKRIYRQVVAEWRRMQDSIRTICVEDEGL